MPSRDQRVRGRPDGAADPAVAGRCAQRGGSEDHDPELADAGVVGRRPRRGVLGLPDGHPPARELFERYGRAAVESCFDAIIDNTTRTFRREILSVIPDGTYTWEDYAEHDGVDPPKLHAQRITLTKSSDDGGKLVLDFTGTGPQAGPDQPLRQLCRRGVPEEVAGAHPAQSGRLAGADGAAGRQRGRRPADRDALPRLGRCSPVFPAPTNARTFVILRLLGVLAGAVAKAVDGRMPADQETIRYTGVYGTDADGSPYLMREVLGGGSGGRYYADGEDTIHVVPDSRNLPTEFSESRSLRRGAARPGHRFRRRRAVPRRARLREAHPDAARRIFHVDRGSIHPVLLGCPRRPGRPAVLGHNRPRWSRRAGCGRAGRRRAGAGWEVIRIRTTGGGGWGDPLDRPYADVLRDLRWRKVSAEGAAADYGVVVTGEIDDAVVDEPASDALRARSRSARTGDEPFFDRGPGYAWLAEERPPRRSTGCEDRLGNGTDANLRTGTPSVEQHDGLGGVMGGRRGAVDSVVRPFPGALRRRTGCPPGGPSVPSGAGISHRRGRSAVGSDVFGCLHPEQQGEIGRDDPRSAGTAFERQHRCGRNVDEICVLVPDPVVAAVPRRTVQREGLEHLRTTNAAASANPSQPG